MNSFLPPDGTQPLDSPENCAQVAPLLIALFDGESNEREAKRARRHLIVCPRCAQCWRAWSENRKALQILEVPAPPPFLLWRVLLSCRFATWKTRVRLNFWKRKSSPAKLGALYHIFEPREAPTSLRAQILAQTTRASQPAQRKFRPRLALSALALPALCAFLLLATRPFASTTTIEGRVSVPTRTAKREFVRTSPMHKRESGPQILPARPPKLDEDEIVVLEQLPLASASQVDFQLKLDQIAFEEQRVLASLESPNTQPLPLEDKSVPTLRPEIMVLPARIQPPPKAEFSDDITLQPRPRLALAARRGAATVSLAAFDSGALPNRVSRPSIGAPPVPLGSTDENSDENFQEIQSAVEEFRAALVEDGMEIESGTAF